MILAFDTSSSACTAALFDDESTCIASRDELIGRGHAERLVPMIADLLGDRSPSSILVGVGPGSFTGIRVAVAAARGMAIGWGARVVGMSSLALLAAPFFGNGEIAAAVSGGHGELFVQQFERGAPTTELRNLAPEEAARFTTADTVVGSGAGQLVRARAWGHPFDAWPSASNAFKLAEQLRNLPPKPVYARAPDARPRQAA